MKSLVDHFQLPMIRRTHLKSALTRLTNRFCGAYVFDDKSLQSSTCGTKETSSVSASYHKNCLGQRPAWLWKSPWEKISFAPRHTPRISSNIRVATLFRIPVVDSSHPLAILFHPSHDRVCHQIVASIPPGDGQVSTLRTTPTVQRGGLPNYILPSRSAALIALHDSPVAA